MIASPGLIPAPRRRSDKVYTCPWGERFSLATAARERQRSFIGSNGLPELDGHYLLFLILSCAADTEFRGYQIRFSAREPVPARLPGALPPHLSALSMAALLRRIN